MKHVYLITNGSRSIQYGVGTYIRQITECFRDISFMHFTIVELNSDVEELEEEYDRCNNIRRLKFPLQDSTGKKEEITHCYRNIAYLLALQFLPGEENVIHLNYLHHAPLIDWLRKIDVMFHLLVTIHYFDWCFFLQGNLCRFHSILIKSDECKSGWETMLRLNYERDKTLFAHADKVICLARSTQILLKDYYEVSEEKTILIYNGLKDEVVWLNELEKMEKKCSLGFQPTDKIILFAGRLDRVKGLDYLIKTFRELLITLPEAKLLIVGDGSYDRYLKECTDLWSKVIFTGKVEKEKLYAFYQIADAGVLPSFHEQCSYVGIEMLMHGLPWIGTDSTGLKEMTENLYCLPQESDGDDLIMSVELMRQWLIDILTQPRSGEFRKRYEERYTLSIMVQKIRFLYLNL